MTSKVVLKAKQSFSQFGVDCQQGQVIPEKVWSKWDGDLLATRLQGGYVEWTHESVAPDGSAVNFNDMAKGELIKYAAEKYETKLDARGSEATLRQQLVALSERHRALAGAKPSAPSAPAKPAEPPAAPVVEPVTEPPADGADGATSEAELAAAGAGEDDAAGDAGEPPAGGAGGSGDEPPVTT